MLDILVQPRRNKQAAKKFFRKLLKGLQYVPRTIVTDKLGSYAAVKAEILPGVEHTRDKRANNRPENPISQRENENVACGASSQLVTHSDSLQPSE